MSPARARGLVAAAVCAFALGLVVPAAAGTRGEADLVERGDLFVRFEGGLDPASLPRDAMAPIGVRVAGTVRTLSGERPPALRQISIALNRGGVLDARGLPVCHRRQIEATSSKGALEACGDALVGRGSYLANTAFPEQGAFPSAGDILAFNAVVNGHGAILAHIFGTDPVPITRIIVFDIRRTSGPYGTRLSGRLPVSVNRYGYVRRISLSLFRRYTYRGRSRSYLSAACPAPPGFPRAVFPFARARMGFADGRTLASTLSRSCRVR